ncbi:unhealthy ribosome biogenesis protein 2 homolog [Aplochiton taeniatus]
MAAVYSGIHLKLKSNRTPWEDKLKLARFAWVSSQCLMPNKEQVLFDWTSHALTRFYSKKVDLPVPVVEGLWSYLDHILHSRKLHKLLSQGKSISLRLGIAQVLIDRLQECFSKGQGSTVGVSTLLSCCHGILSSPSLSATFTTKYELMVDLLVKVCSLACHRLQHQPTTDAHTPLEPITESLTFQDEPMDDSITSQPIELISSMNEALSDGLMADPLPAQSQPIPEQESSQVFEVLLQVLSCYQTVQRQQANPNRVFNLVTSDLLQPLLLLRHRLTTQIHTPLANTHAVTHPRLRPQLSRDLRNKVEAVLQSSLFPPQLLPDYKEELFPAKGDSGKRGAAKGSLCPVNLMLSKLKETGSGSALVHYAVSASAMPLLFKFCLNAYGEGGGGGGGGEGEERMLCFHLLTRLVPALNLDLDYSSSAKTPTPDPQSSEQQAQPEGLSPGEKKRPEPLSWSLGLLALEALLNICLSGDIYNIAADRIKHGEVQLRFYRALVQTLFDQGQASVPAWYRCVKSLLSLNHLILEPDLGLLLSVSWVGSDCQDGRVQRARQALVSALFQTYTKLRQLPRLFSELLAVEEEEEEEEEEMEVQRDGEKEDKALKLLCLSHLLHAVLFSLKTLDNSSPLPLVRQTHSFMENMDRLVRDVLLLGQNPGPDRNPDPGEGTGAAWCPRTLEAGLLLRYTWGEMDSLFSLYSARYAPPASALDPEPASDPDPTPSPVLIHLEGLLSGSALPCSAPSSTTSSTSTQPPSSPLARLLLKQLVLQQLKKALRDGPLLAQSGTAGLLQRAAQSLLGGGEEPELGLTSGGRHWDGQLASVDASSYPVAHWHLVATHLPLLAPHLGRGEVVKVASVLIASLLPAETARETGRETDSLSVSLISRQLLQSSSLPEIPPLYSALVQGLQQRIVGVLVASDAAARVCPALLKLQQASQPMAAEPGSGAVQSEGERSEAPPTLLRLEPMAQEIVGWASAGHAPVSLSDSQSQQLKSLLSIAESLDADGMSPEDFSSLFLVLFLTSTSTQPDRGPGGAPDPSPGAPLLGELLGLLARLLEGRNSHSVLKLVHGSTLLQAATSALLAHSDRGRFHAMDSSDWLALLRAVQGFVRSLLELVMSRHRSVRVNLEQVTSFLLSEEVAGRRLAAMTALGESEPEPAAAAAILSVHIVLASLASLSQVMTSNLRRNSNLDLALVPLLGRTTAMLGLAIQACLKTQMGKPELTQWYRCHSPCSVLSCCSPLLSQAFCVELVSVMLHSDLASQPAGGATLRLHHVTLYRSVSQQILRELSSAPRPTDFLVSSLSFLSAYYRVLERTEGEEKEEVYEQVLQSVYRLLAAPWLSVGEVCDLEKPVEELLRPLLTGSTVEQLNRLLLLLRDGLDTGRIRHGSHREALSAVTLTKLLSGCQMPYACSKVLWLFAPQLITALVFLVRESSLDLSLTSTLTVPAVTSVTSLLRQGESRLFNPQHVTMVLSALQLVPLDHLTPTVYQSVFFAVHEALFAIIQCHSQVMLKAAPSFLNVFYRLVSSVVQEGRQRDTDAGPDSEGVLQCCMLVERMYSHTASVAEGSTTLSSFMVAQYVTELQKVTVRPDVKGHLTEGIYQILDLCLEQDVKFLTASLSPGVREVFNELYSSYTHYHKTQRQGEEKYMA